MPFDRIYFFGDSITLGCNDTAGLGWPGRLCRAQVWNGRRIAAYNLGVNGDTSADIAARWRAEVAARSRNATGLLVFAFGFNDASRRDGGSLQLSLADSRANARSIIAAALALTDVLWIGPTPLDEGANPLQTPYASWETRNADIAACDAGYAELAAELGVAYLALYPRFESSQRYRAALAAYDGVHPADDGYALIAETVAGWDAWQRAVRG